MKTDERLVRAAEMAGVELLPWQAEIGTRLLAGEQIIWQSGRRGGRWTLRKLLADVQARESAGETDG